VLEVCATRSTPLIAWTTQVFGDTHPYKFDPAGEAVLKNMLPVLHTSGSTVPVVKGMVKVAAEKSTSLLCDLKSTCVCP
jgi:hypothetical protein